MLQCKTCEEGEKCLTCFNSENLPPFCLNPINSHTLIMNQEIMEDKKCQIKCKGCYYNELNQQVCQQCQGQNRKYLNQNCLCKDGYHDYYGFSKNCVKCPQNCKNCQDDNTCTECAENEILNKYTQKCQKCEFGQIYNQFTKKCQNCLYFQRECLFKCPRNTKVNENNICITIEIQLKQNLFAYYSSLVVIIISMFAGYIIFALKFQKKIIALNENFSELEIEKEFNEQIMGQLENFDIQSLKREIEKCEDLINNVQDQIISQNVSNKLIKKLQQQERDHLNQLKILRFIQKLFIKQKHKEKANNKELNQKQQQQLNSLNNSPRIIEKNIQITNQNSRPNQQQQSINNNGY
ncbi:Insulin-like growth factor binding protein, N-terminal [Pseudocohnilembus persalinus]|uniref:Insulin-like growth factor binding protein, N-terminal n=1 Tax=Pseudocohnilembus persalinus TaxID=266149 RepID=A0A0V0QV83_PSEPJ|nr:Insulin-like growth factor binding protein, N-terminal [Pseudocohnilembus persalinus]|eukprot:KRX06167.1 Insulin-like growth factor binding protein, N-terminal [Pseudocohnilembus persalinus]